MEVWGKDNKMNKWCFVFSQGGIGEKGAEGTAGNDGARVSESILFPTG